MGAQQVDPIGLGRLPPHQMIAQTREHQPVFNGIEALRAFGMPRAHVVLAAQSMREITGALHDDARPE